MSDVSLGFEFVEAHASLITLLGIKPDHGEVQYGWIQPVITSAHKREQRFFRVRRFWEKPTNRVAQRLMRVGSLWSTFVMIGHVEAFLGIISRTLPNLYRSLQLIRSSAHAKRNKRLNACMLLALQPTFRAKCWRGSLTTYQSSS